jgi:hypothetical protein
MLVALLLAALCSTLALPAGKPDQTLAASAEGSPEGQTVDAKTVHEDGRWSRPHFHFPHRHFPHIHRPHSHTPYTERDLSGWQQDCYPLSFGTSLHEEQASHMAKAATLGVSTKSAKTKPDPEEPEEPEPEEPGNKRGVSTKSAKTKTKPDPEEPEEPEPEEPGPKGASTEEPPFRITGVTDHGTKITGGDANAKLSDTKPMAFKIDRVYEMGETPPPMHEAGVHAEQSNSLIGRIDGKAESGSKVQIYGLGQRPMGIDLVFDFTIEVGLAATYSNSVSASKALTVVFASFYGVVSGAISIGFNFQMDGTASGDVLVRLPGRLHLQRGRPPRGGATFGTPTLTYQFNADIQAAFSADLGLEMLAFLIASSALAVQMEGNCALTVAANNNGAGVSGTCTVSLGVQGEVAVSIPALSAPNVNFCGNEIPLSEVINTPPWSGSVSGTIFSGSKTMSLSHSTGSGGIGMHAMALKVVDGQLLQTMMANLTDYTIARRAPPARPRLPALVQAFDKPPIIGDLNAEPTMVPLPGEWPSDEQLERAAHNVARNASVA